MEVLLVSIVVNLSVLYVISPTIRKDITDFFDKIKEKIKKK